MKGFISIEVVPAGPEQIVPVHVLTPEKAVLFFRNNDNFLPDTFRAFPLRANCASSSMSSLSG